MQIFVNYKQLVSNVKKVKTKLNKNVKLCAVVKANAYGHDIVKSAIAIKNEVDYFAVAKVDEGLVLRQNSITKPILVLDPSYTKNQVEICAENNISLTLCNLFDVKKIFRAGVKVHLKIDSGMNRIGVKDNDEFLQLLKECKRKNICVQGVYSHFASDVNCDVKNTFDQFNNFCKMSKIAKEVYPQCLLHICNSSNFFCAPAFHFDMVRVGLALYNDCKKVVATIIETKQLKAGELAGYNGCFVADRDCAIAIADCGYGDGLPRRYNGQILSRYGKMDVVGKACMDMIMINNRDNLLKKGDKVVILGKYNKNVVKAGEIAKNCDTIPYEILCNLRER